MQLHKLLPGAFIGDSDCWKQFQLQLHLHLHLCVAFVRFAILWILFPGRYHCFVRFHYRPTDFPISSGFVVSTQASQPARQTDTVRHSQTVSARVCKASSFFQLASNSQPVLFVQLNLPTQQFTPSMDYYQQPRPQQASAAAPAPGYVYSQVAFNLFFFILTQ